MRASTIAPNNVHVIERTFRVLLGVGLISLAFVGPQTAWGWLGLIPLITGLSGTCPIYTILGFSTCRMKAVNR